MKSISFVVFLILISITFVNLSMAQKTVSFVLPLSMSIEDGGSGPWKAMVTGDTRSSRMFLGSDCGFCKDTLWKVESKNFIH